MIRKQTCSILAAATLVAMLAAGCTTTDPYTGQQQQNRTGTGALIGAGIGIAAGLLTGDSAVERRQHALIGAGIGALSGGAIGNYQDRQQAALNEKLRGTGVDVARKGDNITLNMPGNVTFAFNSANIDPSFYPVLNDVAGVLREYNQTVVEVAGHTDNIGSEDGTQSPLHDPLHGLSHVSFSLFQIIAALGFPPLQPKSLDSACCHGGAEPISLRRSFNTPNGRRLRQTIALSNGKDRGRGAVPNFEAVHQFWQASRGKGSGAARTN